MRFIAALSLLLVVNPAIADEIRHFGGPVQYGQGPPTSDYELIESQLPTVRYDPSKGPVLFIDPMEAAGGMNAPTNVIGQYVDHYYAAGVLDYTCGPVSYDGHAGTDCGIFHFYAMDEGVPVQSVAPGTVIYTRDGEYDRHTEGVPGAISNMVYVQHADGTVTRYYHLKKNSVCVTNGQEVAAGDVVGMVGSSGPSSGPHLHFEVRDPGIVDPYHGDCSSDPSRWITQGAYTLDFPFFVFDHGVTTILLDWAMLCERPPTCTHVTYPGTIYPWISIRNVLATDELSWKIYRNGSLWVDYGFVVGGDGEKYAHTVWWTIWNLPGMPWDFGDWSVQICRNDIVISQDDFTYDGQANQLPVVQEDIFEVEEGSSVSGEFVANDPDGSIFWYEIVTPPSNGTLDQYGGRKRKFTYTPDPGFLGEDHVVLYAIDDHNAAGPNGTVTFTTTTDVETDVVPETHERLLAQNHPNPFSRTTTIRFVSPEPQHVGLNIYGIDGRKVITLLDETVRSGSHDVVWNGKDASGKKVAPGIYLYTLVSDGTRETRRMLLVK
jgi:hypothetical protein